MDAYKTRKCNEIIEKLKEYKKDYENKIELWRKVERIKKKNGEDFSIFSKNFKNAKISPSVASIRPDLEIWVNDYVNGVYTSDYFEVMPCVKYYKGVVSEDRIIKESYLEPYFKMTIEEIMQEIENRIKTYEEYINDLNRQIDNAEKIFNQFSTTIDNALTTLKKDAGNNSSLYFACREYMTRAY